MHSFSTRFPKQLRYWTIYCILNALPGLGLSLHGNFGKHASSVLGISLAISTFIVTFSALTSLPGALADDTSLPSRALKTAIRIRSWTAVTSLLFVPSESTFLFIPDSWCGVIALFAAPVLFPWKFNPVGFLTTYTLTIMVGLMLTVLVVALWLFVLIVLAIRNYLGTKSRSGRIGH